MFSEQFIKNNFEQIIHSSLRVNFLLSFIVTNIIEKVFTLQKEKQS